MVEISDLQPMMLEKEELPPDFDDFHLSKDEGLDNAKMAEGSFPGNTEESFREAGRITGHMRDFTKSMSSPPFLDGTNFVVSTAVHLFEDPQSVSNWITEIFLGQFEENVGCDLPFEQQMTSVERLEAEGFYDETAALRALYELKGGRVSSSIVDFRLGRLLGVAFVLTLGDAERHSLAERVASLLERKMVRALLG